MEALTESINLEAFTIMKLFIITYFIMSIFQKIRKKIDRNIFLLFKMMALISVIGLIIPLIEVYSGINLYSYAKESIMVTPFGEFEKDVTKYYILAGITAVLINTGKYKKIA